MGKAGRYDDWDKLVWLLYDNKFNLREGWLWDCRAYRRNFDALPRVRPAHMRKGHQVWPKALTAHQTS